MYRLGLKDTANLIFELKKSNTTILYIYSRVFLGSLVVQCDLVHLLFPIKR